MTTLRAIRARLGAVKNIQKITRAMEMIAASRLHRAQAKAMRIRPYLAAMKTLLSKVSKSSALSKHPTLSSKEVKKTALVVVSADRGLCGGYNMHILNAANTFLKKYDPAQIELILFGRKAIQHYRLNKKWSIREEISGWGGKLSFEEIEEISNQWFNLFMTSGIDEFWIIYTHFVNVLNRKVIIEKFLNLENLQPKETSQDTFRDEYIFESDPTEIYEELIPRYLAAKVQSVLNEAYASELAARTFAMKAASSNAETKIGELTQLRNKVRQEGITKEMLEIATGANL